MEVMREYKLSPAAEAGHSGGACGSWIPDAAMFLEIKNLEYAYRNISSAWRILTFLRGDYCYPGENGAEIHPVEINLRLLTSRHGRILLKVKISRAPGEMLPAVSAIFHRIPTLSVSRYWGEEIAYGLKVRGKKFCWVEETLQHLNRPSR